MVVNLKFLYYYVQYTTSILVYLSNSIALFSLVALFGNREWLIRGGCFLGGTDGRGIMIEILLVVG